MNRCIVHEIKNQISICELYTQVIKKNLENEGVKNKSLENAIKCINKSLKLMNNSLIDLKSEGSLNTELFDIKSMLEQAVELAGVYCEEKNTKITLKAESVYAEIDKDKFLGCIINIIKNASESIEKNGKIELSLETSNNQALIKISNNGKEIPAEIQNHIFEKGFTTKKNGSGLGLHICYENLKAQNAELKLNKSVAGYTEFGITIPVNQPR